MANRIAGRPWTFDTATPGVPAWHAWMKISNIIWAGGGPGESVVLNDVNNALVFSASSNGTMGGDVVSWKIGWVQGLIPEVIGGGTVIVYVE